MVAGRTRRGTVQATVAAVPPALVGVIAVGGVLALWQAAAVSGLLPATSVPPATAVGREFVGLMSEQTFWQKFAETGTGWAIGVLLTALVAIPVGLALGVSAFLHDSGSGLIEVLKPIPPIALIPLTLLMWGPALQMKLFLIVFGSVWPLLTQIIYGVRRVDHVALEMSRTYGLGWRRTTTHVVMPSILPYLSTGLRISAAIGLIISLVAEMIAGNPGLGQLIVVAQSSNALGRMYALIIVTGLMGLAINHAFALLDRWVLAWHPSNRKERE